MATRRITVIKTISSSSSQRLVCLSPDSRNHDTMELPGSDESHIMAMSKLRLENWEGFQLLEEKNLKKNSNSNRLSPIEMTLIHDNGKEIH